MDSKRPHSAPNRERRPTGAPVKRSLQPESGEIYLEFSTVGTMIRVAAVDAATGVEVVISGPLSTPQSDLERLAVRKLHKRIEALKAERSAGGGGRGRVI